MTDVSAPTATPQTPKHPPKDAPPVAGPRPRIRYPYAFRVAFSPSQHAFIQSAVKSNPALSFSDIVRAGIDRLAYDRSHSNG